MNLLEAQAASATSLRVGGVILDLPAALHGLARGAATLGIRPAAIAITAPDSAGTLAGSVALVEHIGAESLISVKLDAASASPTPTWSRHRNSKANTAAFSSSGQSLCRPGSSAAPLRSQPRQGGRAHGLRGDGEMLVQRFTRAGCSE